ncbi:DUF6882 domain-containing protein [Actinomadura sp. 7K507]|uniref:DUF6882 domain-containing protein n=1 Tax=Actinomadura sp. 7K507 TaxID=2530365 RepID=UPI00104BE1C9|nr:DUF6882 domain-containing protein [Actinomadura sp. 7K507]TDC85883.1 hypothetical protein E1285_24375 [Actinomadura sp. 7K507]
MRTASDGTFRPPAFLSLEHQLHLEEVLGDHSWNVDLQQQRFEFTGSRPLACTGFHLLGSAAPGPGSWLWAWANPSGFPAQVTALSATLREFGQRHGIAELTSAEVPFHALPGSPGEAAVAAASLTDAAKAITGGWTSYNGDAGGGTRAAFLIEHPDFQLPPPEPARVMRVLQQGLAGLRMTDHRRAVHSYAQRRGLGSQFSADYMQFSLTGPGFGATIDFDQYNRIANIKATLSAPNGT